MNDWTWSVAEILLNAVWIAAAAYLTAWTVCRVRTATPHMRGAVCLAALAASAALPSLQRVEWPNVAPERTEIATDSLLAFDPVGLEPVPSEPTGAWPLQIEAGPLAEALVRTSLLGSLCGFAYLVFGLVTALRLKSRSRQAGGEWARRERLWASADPRGARLLLSDEITAPVAVGWFRPAVLFPPQLADTLDDRELERLWLHEAAHLERYDDWSILLEKACLALLWFHPAAWRLSRQVAIEREMACDAVAAERSGSRREYARTLTRLAQLRVARRVAPALSIAGESSLSRRIEMLLHDRPGSGGRLGRAGLALAATACAAAAVAVLTIGPLIGLAQTPPTVPSEAAPASPASPPSPPAPPSPAESPVIAAKPAPPAAPAPIPMPAPQPKPVPQAAPKPTPPPSPPSPPRRVREGRLDPQAQAEIRALSEEIREMSRDLHRQVEVQLKPLHDQMRAVGKEMRLKSEPFAERMRILAKELAELHAQSPLTQEQEQEIEAKAREMESQSQELQRAIESLQDRMEQLQIEVKPNEEMIRAIEEKVRAKSAEIERRIQEKMDQREQREERERREERSVQP